ncbi:MAG TPA: glycosyltransferase [Caulobacteraceae bacterium]|nr:glycosyltransferase [Caulobacteraceae bacterium]
MKTALVHYWLVGMRGGEAVFRKFMDLHPGSDVFTNVYKPEGVASMFEGRPPPTTTWVNNLPGASKLYPLYMPLMPSALEQLDLSGYDLVISSESGPAKWVITDPGARHVCYVHTPMRYLWDQRLAYREKVPSVFKPIFDSVTHKLRIKDVISATRVDDFVANSSFVASRIHRYYGRKATVIPPPVEAKDIGPPTAPEDFYLFAGQLVSYKRVDLAIRACQALGRRLVIAGDGSQRGVVEKLKSSLVDFRGRVSREELVDLMGRCRALLFPGVEDFGIVPVEVMAAGRPVIGFAQGGLLDSVEHLRSGFLYQGGSLDDLIGAIQAFETWESDFSPAAAVSRARHFSADAFSQRWLSFIDGSGSAKAA